MSLGRSLIIIVVCLSAASAQAPAKRTPEQLQASYDAHKGDFDYLLGDWDFSAESREFGKFRGYWSAVRLDGGQILDEYRVVGDKGETFYVTSTLRSYNKTLDTDGSSLVWMRETDCRTSARHAASAPRSTSNSGSVL